MKSRFKKDGPHNDTNQSNSSNSIKKNMMKKKKNVMRLGGGGLSLEAFANAKSKNNEYNPALIKKQKEFYKNAKCVSKYKKSLKQQCQPSDLSSVIRLQEDKNETGDTAGMNKKNKKSRKMSGYSLRQLYEQRHEEEEKARKEREAIIQAKKEEREKAESRRKAIREKMFKKTRSGQPVMKYRIEHLLESIQSSANK